MSTNVNDVEPSSSHLNMGHSMTQPNLGFWMFTPLVVEILILCGPSRVDSGKIPDQRGLQPWFYQPSGYVKIDIENDHLTIYSDFPIKHGDFPQLCWITRGVYSAVFHIAI